jgi:hypothetical protein
MALNKIVVRCTPAQPEEYSREIPRNQLTVITVERFWKVQSGLDTIYAGRRRYVNRFPVCPQFLIR